MSRKTALFILSALFAALTCLGALCAVSVRSRSDMVAALYEMALRRTDGVTLTYDGSIKKIFSEDIEALSYEITAIDDPDTSDDIDYLEGCINRFEAEWKGDSRQTTIEFRMTYNESASQLAKVNARIPQVLKRLGVDGATDYEKVKLIHDFIVNNTTYDSSYRIYSAYGALINKKAVCQGYALLAYKMLTEAGVPCRYVYGTAGGDHAWNIVKLDGKWYHMDVTWDDPIGEPRLIYDYFLVGSDRMNKDHTLDKAFQTRAFTRKYPVSADDYKQLDAEVIEQNLFRHTEDTTDYSALMTLNSRIEEMYSKYYMIEAYVFDSDMREDYEDIGRSMDELVDVLKEAAEEGVFEDENTLREYVRDMDSIIAEFDGFLEEMEELLGAA